MRNIIIRRREDGKLLLAPQHPSETLHPERARWTDDLEIAQRYYPSEATAVIRERLWSPLGGYELVTCNAFTPTEVIAWAMEHRRLRLVRSVERFPHFIAPEGATGTVVFIATDREGDFAIWLQLDEPVDGALEWDNCVVWTADDVTDSFRSDVEPCVEREHAAGDCAECGAPAAIVATDCHRPECSKAVTRG